MSRKTESTSCCFEGPPIPSNRSRPALFLLVRAMSEYKRTTSHSRTKESEHEEAHHPGHVLADNTLAVHATRPRNWKKHISERKQVATFEGEGLEVVPSVKPTIRSKPSQGEIEVVSSWSRDGIILCYLLVTV